MNKKIKRNEKKQKQKTKANRGRAACPRRNSSAAAAWVTATRSSLVSWLRVDASGICFFFFFLLSFFVQRNELFFYCAAASAIYAPPIVLLIFSFFYLNWNQKKICGFLFAVVVVVWPGRSGRGGGRGLGRKGAGLLALPFWWWLLLLLLLLRQCAAEAQRQRSPFFSTSRSRATWLLWMLLWRLLLLLTTTTTMERHGSWSVRHPTTRNGLNRHLSLPTPPSSAFSRLLPVFFYRVFPTCTGLYRVLPSFNLVSQGFTGFYWVLLGFT